MFKNMFLDHQNWTQKWTQDGPKMAPKVDPKWSRNWTHHKAGHNQSESNRSKFNSIFKICCCGLVSVTVWSLRENVPKKLKKTTGQKIEGDTSPKN